MTRNGPPDPKPTQIVVYKPGDRVTIDGRNLEAIIESVTIAAAGAVWYHVAWWLDGRRTEADLMACEITPAETYPLRIGFYTPNLRTRR